MNMYRIKQFYIYIKDKMEYSDEKFIDKHLNNYEKRLFNRLSMKDQKHCVRVAYDVEKICINHKGDIDTNKLIKAALLHDIGKIEFGLNVLDKSILVILDNISSGKIKKFSKSKKIDTYYNHAEKGYNILKSIGYDESFLYLIRNHHNKNITKNKELNILRFCDDRN